MSDPNGAVYPLPERILLGPGPSNVPPAVLEALSRPTIGHLDPAFLKLLDETCDRLRAVFQTQYPLTLPVSGTGSAGMEMAFSNLVEPGDVVVIGVNGIFGQRMADVAGRCGAQVVEVPAPWGRIVEPEDIYTAIGGKAVKMIAVVHAETSTGVLQPLGEISKIARECEALFLVDAVTSLGGHPVEVDRQAIDCCYSGTQKALSCPPGLAPITFSPAAAAVFQSRKTKVQSWYLDMNLIQRYVGTERLYHHTAPVNMIYGLHEALGIILREGLEARWDRHRRNSEALQAGLAAMGIGMFAQAGHRLWTLNAVTTPEGVDDVALRRRLLERFSIEIGGGLGELKGKIWRVGLMGHSSTQNNVLLFLAALEDCLRHQGISVEPGAGVASAGEYYAQEERG